MANTIRIKRSTGSSAPGSLENAELAFAEGSKKLFIGIGTGGSGGSATTIEAIGGSGSFADLFTSCLLYTSPSPRDLSTSRMPSSA